MKRFRSIGWIVLLVFALGALYLLTRLPYLTTLPIFTDEAIYIRWSQIGTRDAFWRMISLTDGKQPFFTWVVMVLLRVVPDALAAGRLASVFAGVVTATGVGFLAHILLNNRRVTGLAVCMYIISPFALMYDRLALYDSWVAAFAVWSMVLSIHLVRTLRMDVALILGMVLGAGMLNKSSAFLSLYMLPVTLVLFDWKRERRFSRLAVWGGLVIVAAVVSQVMYAVLRLSPYYHMIGLKNTVFLYPFSEWITHPLRFVEGNLKGLFDWTRGYMTTPVFFASLAPLFFPGKTWKQKLVLYSYWILPFVALATFAKVLYPRFIFFMIVPLYVLAAYSIDTVVSRLGRSFLTVAIITIIVFPAMYADYIIVTNPLHAPIPQSDRGQFIDDWPAGWGVAETAQYLEEQSRQGEIVVYTEGTFGLMPYGLEILLVDNPRVAIHGIWPLPKEMPDEIRAAASAKPTFLVLNETQEAPENWPLMLVAQYQKGLRSDRALRLFQVVDVMVLNK